ncbi:MAG: hypothetical protein ACXWK5_06330 [Myxococcaceae bacterium]
MSPRSHRVLVATVVLAGLTGCSTTSNKGTHFVSTWKAPDAAPLTVKQGDKVVAMVISREDGTRRKDEDALCDELRARGFRPIPSYTLVPTDQVDDQAKALATIRSSAATAIFGARPISTDTSEKNVPTQWAGGSPLYDFGTFYNLGWQSQTTPAHTVTTTVVRIQLLVYSLPQEKLLWSAESVTTDPGQLDSFFAELVKAAAAQMTREGVLAAPAS